MNINIRPSVQADLATFFIFQCDKQVNYMAAFTSTNPYDKAAYLAKWEKLMRDDTVHIQSILLHQEVIGNVAKFELQGEACITYTIDRNYWGKGYATAALQQFLLVESVRPMYGRVAHDNIGSQRVLEKAGFVRIGQAIHYAHARKQELLEFIYKLD